MHNDMNDYLRFLSGNMRQMADVIGIENTISVMKQYGGQVLSMVTGKRNSTAKTKLTSLLGDKQANLLIREFSGELIYIPLYSSLKSATARYRRDKEINAKLEQLTRDNLSYRRAIEALSNEFNITDRQIYKIISRG